MTVDGKVAFTPEEESAADKKKVETLAARPLRDWHRGMEESDHIIPRVIEDIYDVLTAAQKSSIATETKDKITTKKALRNSKP